MVQQGNFPRTETSCVAVGMYLYCIAFVIRVTESDSKLSFMHRLYYLWCINSLVCVVNRVLFRLLPNFQVTYQLPCWMIFVLQLRFD